MACVGVWSSETEGKGCCTGRQYKGITVRCLLTCYDESDSAPEVPKSFEVAAD